ncbi:MAG: type II CAAX endopeptidase family protein [Candidatus Neomarinimicrobiota bacterium]
MNRTPSAATAFSVVLISVLLAALLTATVGLVFGVESGEKTLVYLSIFIGQGFMAVPLLFYLHSQGISFRRSLRLNPVGSVTVLATVLVAVGAVFIADELDRLVSLIFPAADSLMQIGQVLIVDSALSAIILFIGLGILAPIGEELLFRGYLQGFLEEHWQDVTRAVLVTAMAFALAHMNPFWLVQAYLMGVLLGYLTWRTDSVLPAILLHGIYNAVALLITNLQNVNTTLFLWGDHVSPLWLLLAAGLIVAGFKLIHKTLEAAR